LKKVLILLVFLLPASLILLSCGGYSSPSSGGGSGIKYRAFITNNVSAGTGLAGVYIVDAAKDVRGSISPISAGNTPGMMVVTPNRTLTLVFSGNGTQFSDNQFTIISNAGEAAGGHVTLPGLTESFVVSPDSSAAYVAVPTASVTRQSPGVIDFISLSSGTKTEISCPPYNPNVMNPVCLPNPVPQPPPTVCDVTPYVCGGFNPPYRFLSIGNTGNRVLAFSEGSDAVANAIAVITPSSVGTANPVVTFVSGSGTTAFNHPVWAFFNSDDTIAYVVNCGAECGGTRASVQTLDLTTNPPTPGTPVPVPAATVALVNNSTMYLAGTPLPAVSCTIQQVQTTCGELTTFDLASMSVVGSPVPINDGYHNRIAFGANGQLFIGARTCSQAGCLSIYNTQNSAVGTVPPGGVGFPPAPGDVTGIQPIATRTVVYVVQGGTLYVYDTTTDAVDAVEEQKLSNLIGDFVDIKTIDF
jgi:hypothetical protein